MIIIWKQVQSDLFRGSFDGKTIDVQLFSKNWRIVINGIVTKDYYCTSFIARDKAEAAAQRIITERASKNIPAVQKHFSSEYIVHKS